MGIIKYIDLLSIYQRLSQTTNMEPLIINNQQKCTVKDVPAKEFIEAFARHLKKGNKIKMPEWVAYYLYMRGKVGVNTLRKHYSGKHRRGTRTEHSRLTAGKCIRYCLLELERAQFVGKMQFENNDGNLTTHGKALTKN